MQEGKLLFQIDADKIAAEEMFDSCCVIITDSALSKENAVRSYNGLVSIERAY
jgi:hypothetical protein